MRITFDRGVDFLPVDIIKRFVDRLCTLLHKLYRWRRIHQSLNEKRQTRSEQNRFDEPFGPYMFDRLKNICGWVLRSTYYHRGIDNCKS